mgnify:FL=1
MTTFSDRFVSVGLPLLMAEMGERVVYRPLNGKPRTITAIVDRNPPEAVSGTEAPTFNYTVTVIADMQAATYGGIEAIEIDTGGDKIDLAPRRGNPVASRQVAVVLESDSVALVLGVR